MNENTRRELSRIETRKNEVCSREKTVSLEKLRENELISVFNLSEFTYPFDVC